jgi:sterol 3beta-glucosyltransferase
MDFSESIEIKVLEKVEPYSLDSYFFAYFHDIPGALEQIREAVRSHNSQPASGTPQAIVDTTVSRHPAAPIDRTVSLPEPTSYSSSSSKISSAFRLPSFFRPFHETSTRSLPQPSSVQETTETEDFTHIGHRLNSSSFVPMTSSPMELSTETDESQESLPPRSPPAADDHTYPPSASASHIEPDHISLSRESSSWAIGVPSWLKGTKRMIGGSLGLYDHPSISSSTGVKEMYSSSTLSPAFPSSRSTAGDLTFSILETPDVPADIEATEKFRSVFAYDEKETLLGCTFRICSSSGFTLSLVIPDFPGYIYRLLPVYGRLYISTNFFCFKSSGPLTVRTRVCTLSSLILIVV